MSIKTFFRDLISGIAGFYCPVLLLSGTIILTAGLQQRDLFRWLYLGNIIVPCIVSLYVFFGTSRRWVNKPSPLVTLLGIWIGGPISIIAGTYLGFFGALILATPTYLVLAVIGRRRKALKSQ